MRIHGVLAPTSVLLIGLFSVASLAQTTFPEVKDQKTVVITLWRWGGMGGDEPSYLLIVSGDGTVQYEGHGSVFVHGKRTGHISNFAMKQMIETFRQAHFFELQDCYCSRATDLPRRAITFQAGSITRKVTDYGFHPSGTDFPEGSLSGAPQSLVDLENRIEQLANARRWVKGNWYRRVMHWR